MGISKEAEISIAALSMFPGFKFSPTDEQLIVFYLKKKVDGFSQCVEVINEVDICKYEPWDLPAKSIIKSDHEWFFFSPRGKRTRNGTQSKRATEIGYWKATGKERGVKSGPDIIGTKRTLVFHIGRAPKGKRTEWILYEYCQLGNAQDSLVICRLRKVSSSSSSSHDSHSVEQNVHVLESEQKLREDVMEPESSSQIKGNNEDDYFADILNDNIIELDESGLLCTRNKARLRMQDGTTRDGGHQATYRQQSIQPFMSHKVTANRRLKMKKIREEFYKVKKEKKKEMKGVSKRWWVGVRLTNKMNPLYVVMIITGLVAFVFTSLRLL